MNVYKIELLLADEYSDPARIVDDITDIISEYADDGERVFVKVISCKRQDLDIASILFDKFDDSKAENVLVK